MGLREGELQGPGALTFFPLCSLSRMFCDLPGWGSLMLRNEKGGVFADS